MINNTMMIQIPILAVLFLGENFSMKELAGMLIARAGVMIVQIMRKNKSSQKTTSPV